MAKDDMDRLYKTKNLSWWKQQQLKTKVEICNRLGCIAAGTRVTIYAKYSGFEIDSQVCEVCGFRLRISQVSPSALQIIENDITNS